MKNIFYLFFFYFFLSLFSSCSPEQSSSSVADSKLDWLFVFYFSADSNLEKYALADLKELEKAGSFISDYATVDSKMKIVAYIDFKDSFNRHPLVFEVSPNSENKISSQIIKTYPEKDSSDVNHLREYLNFVKAKYPSQKIALFLSSHSNGWFPTKKYKNAQKEDVQLNEVVLSSQNQKVIKKLSQNNIHLKGFSLDESSQNNEMDIFELTEIFEDNEFEVIAFDSCSMADIETIYQLKDKTKYIVASQSEILGYGYPYETIFRNAMQQLTKGELHSKNFARSVAKEVYSFYQTHNNFLYRSVSISAIATEKLTNFAKEVKTLYQKIHQQSPQKITEQVKKNNFTNTSFGNDYSFFKYDLKGWLQTINKKTVDKNFDSIQKIFNEVIIANYHSEKFLATHPMNYFFGINIYIPYQNLPELWNYYKNYQWVKDSDYEVLFN